MKVRTIVVCLVACTLAGCGGEGLPLAPVSGVIKLNGKPLEGATVTFIPLRVTEENTPISFDKTDDEGRYSLETAAGDVGAYIGSHRVTIVKQKGGDVDDSDDSIIEFEELIPPEYNEESTQKFEVTKEGSDIANWDIKAPKGWQKQRRDKND